MNANWFLLALIIVMLPNAINGTLDLWDAWQARGRPDPWASLASAPIAGSETGATDDYLMGYLDQLEQAAPKIAELVARLTPAKLDLEDSAALQILCSMYSNPHVIRIQIRGDVDAEIEMRQHVIDTARAVAAEFMTQCGYVKGQVQHVGEDEPGFVADELAALNRVGHDG